VRKGFWKYSRGENSERNNIDEMVGTASVAAGAQRLAACGVAALRAGSRAVNGLARWFAFEVLPLPMSTKGYHVVGVACRLVACGVSLGILSVALQASTMAHGKALALLWAGSALTALLIGNIAREFMFVVCSSVTTWMGHAFHRDGVTLGGRTFLEIHDPTMTWIRCECGADEFSCEWTEPSGRCNRVDVQLRANRLIRVTTAPKMSVLLQSRTTEVH
jgi:hypothetical protein